MHDIFNTQRLVKVFKLCDNAPTTRIAINQYAAPYQPYFHSFGLTQSWAILPHQSFFINYDDIVIWGTTLDVEFTDLNQTDTTIMLVPLNGDTPLNVTLANYRLYFTHVINAFERANSVVFDGAFLF